MLKLNIMIALRYQIFLIFFLAFSMEMDGQFFDNLAKRAKKKVERETEKRSERRVDRGVDKVFDAVEEGADAAIDGDKKKSKQKSSNRVKTPDADNNGSEGIDNSDLESPNDDFKQDESISSPQEEPSVLSWAKYDFVPGVEIIFEDNQQNEQNGEFPSKWDLVKGTVENANFNGENVIYFLETGNFPNGISPLIKDPSVDYLPEEFTVEFDAYFEKGKYSNYYLFFYDANDKKQKKIKDGFVTFYVNGAKFGYSETAKSLDNVQFSNIDKKNSHWRHFSISFNKRALKVYLDDTRLLNIPNIKDNYTGITLSVNHARQADKQFVKNIRIAKGAVPLYDKVLTDGKFVTTGIKFDVNKATIKSESAGTLNYVLEMMKSHPDLKFCVEGHTDSDGDDASNQRLSEMRAKSVREELIKLGITPERLTSKGWGESKPVADNLTPEGKAQNRRVEFVKM
mgnify:CR=1 FL=1